MSADSSTPLYRHSSPYRELARRYRHYFGERDFRDSVIVATLALALGWFTNYFVIKFATERASNSVTDIILSNIPVFEVDGFFIYGTFIFTFVAAGILLSHPKRIPFAFKAVALFWIIRSIFASLTHIAPFEAAYISDFGSTINDAFFGGDLFFSAHTGMPFLGALVCWKEKGIRNFFLAGSLFFAVVVLLGHVHYSIDVLAAFFITYSIFHLAEWMFPKDRAMFLLDETSEANKV